MSAVRNTTLEDGDVPEHLSSTFGSAKKALTDSTCLNFTLDEKPRTVEVHAIGKSTKDGSLVLRGFQVAGGSSRPLPVWALFRLDRMSKVIVTDRASEAPRDGYRMGDSQMDPVLSELDIS